MKVLVMSLLFSVLLLGYEKGDQVSDTMVKHLGLSGEKVYIIDFFASWCGSCKKELPLISKLNSQIDKSKVEIIGIDADKDMKKAQKFQAELKAKGHLDFKVVNDPQNLVIAEFNPIGMPSLYYVKEGKVVGMITGAVDDIDQQILNDLKAME